MCCIRSAVRAVPVSSAVVSRLLTVLVMTSSARVAQAQFHFIWYRSMTVPETAAALNELHTRLAVEELINGSADRGLSGAITRLMLIEQFVHRTGTLRPSGWRYKTVLVRCTTTC